MNGLVRKYAVQAVALLCVVGLTMPGCATTKHVMNKATFGLVGGDEKKAEDTQQASAAQPQEETKAERKAREKEEKQQRKAEKEAEEDQEKAAKAAEKEQKEQAEGDKPGLMSRMTFGLVGGEKKSDEEKQQEADAKAAEEQEKQQERDAERKQEREEKAQKEEAKRLAKEEKEKAKAEEKQAEAAAAGEKPEAEQKEPGEKRSLMSRMTFGLVGGKGEKQEEVPAADAPAPAAATAPEAPVTEATPATAAPATAPAAPSPEAAAAAPAPEVAAAPADEPSKDDKKAQKRAEKEQREAEKQAKKDAEKAEKEAANQAEADQKAAEQSSTEEQPKEKRSLMSKMTFGLVGGKGKDEKKEEPAQEGTTEVAANTPAQPALPPEQAAMAAPTDVQYDLQPASALDGEARKLAKLDFKTTIDLSTKSASGKGQATASRETYSKSGYGITDLGDVRIAVQGMTFDGESRGGGVVISSDDRAAAGGKSGKGNDAFIFEYAKGVTAVQFGTVKFTIAKSVISIGGKLVPMGQGKKLIVVDGQGNVIGAYAAE